MSDVAIPPQVRSALQRFSDGEISRRELGDALGTSWSFGDVLMMLHRAHLPLPRYGHSSNPQGVEFVAQLVKRARSQPSA